MAVPEEESRKDGPGKDDLAIEDTKDVTQEETGADGAIEGAADPVEDIRQEESEETAAASESGTPTLEERLSVALEEVGRFKDVALRAEAEIQNMRRRTARDVENAHRYGLERFLRNLLPVVDSFEKAIETSGSVSDEAGRGDATVAVVEGVRLCHKLLMDVFGKEGVEVVDPLGEPFDPNVHQAMSVVENPDMEPNSVFAVVQKGYRLNGRLVRPAMVMVTRAVQAAAAEGPARDPDTDGGSREG